MELVSALPVLALALSAIGLVLILHAFRRVNLEEGAASPFTIAEGVIGASCVFAGGGAAIVATYLI